LTNLLLIFSSHRANGFAHGKVNHSEHFKDPVTGVNTKKMEGLWAHMKRTLIGGGYRKRNMYGHTARFMVLQRIDRESEPFIRLVSLVNEWYAVGSPIGTFAFKLKVFFLIKLFFVAVDLAECIPGPPLVLEDPESEDENVEDETSIRETIASWLEGSESCLEFPSTLSVSERRIVHVEAENLSLHHRSRGTGEARQVTVRRPLVEQQQEAVGTVNPVRRSISEDVPQIRSSKRARKHPSYLDDYL
jgi:R3H domain